jgi:hypothetical protein
VQPDRISLTFREKILPPSLVSNHKLPTSFMAYSPNEKIEAIYSSKSPKSFTRVECATSQRTVQLWYCYGNKVLSSVTMTTGSWPYFEIVQKIAVSVEIHILQRSPFQQCNQPSKCILKITGI